jgi:biotin carboxylase
MTLLFKRERQKAFYFKSSSQIKDYEKIKACNIINGIAIQFQRKNNCSVKPKLQSNIRKVSEPHVTQPAFGDKSFYINSKFGSKGYSLSVFRMTPFSRNNSINQDPLEPAVVVCTPYSTGCCIAKEVMKRGYKMICLWSSGFSEAMKLHVPKSANGLKWELVLDEQDTIELTAMVVNSEANLHGMKVVSVICGGEAGVDLADALSEHLGFVTNGTDIPNRRDKKVQQELIRDAGLRATRQACSDKFEDVEEFLRTEQYPVILKPLDSAGSDGVKKCDTFEEAKEHFHYLMEEHNMVNGGNCGQVLCQEFLKGKEYVVDHVSRDGVHKTVMLWVYDKHPANGASFVYYGDIPVDSESPEAKALIPYCRGVLDALGVKHGPSHGEFIMTEDGPCLVEMNCRAHGGDGIWQPLCRGLTGGYNQVDATADAYFNKEKFFALPDKPCSPFKTNGQCVDLVSYKAGTVKAIPGYDVMRILPSFVHMECNIKPGSKVKKTVDLATDAGTLVVMNKNKEALDRDISLIRHMETTGVLFHLEEDDVLPPEEKKEEITKTIPCEKQTFCPVNQTRSHRRLISNETPAMFLASQHI